jgi:hypothetical protein
VFSALVGFSLYTTSTHHRIKQSAKGTTGMSSVAYVILCWEEIRVVVNRKLAPLSRQCSSTFLEHDSDVLAKKTYSCGLLGFLFFWHSSLRLLAVPARRSDTFLTNGNLTRALNTTSLNSCLPSTDAIDRRKKFTRAYQSSWLPHASALHWNPPGIFFKDLISYTIQYTYLCTMLIFLSIIDQYNSYHVYYYNK